MKAVSGKHLVKLAKAKGWQLARVVGSHHILVMEGREETLSIPVHGNKTLKRGTQRAIMKILKLTDGDL